MYNNFDTHTNIYHYSIFDLNYIAVLLNLHIQSHEICFINVLASFVFIKILKSGLLG